MARKITPRLLSISLALVLFSGLWQLPVQAAAPPEAPPAEDAAVVTVGPQEEGGEYETVQAAYDALPPAGGTIRLLADVSEAGALSLAAEMPVTLDLNGWTLATPLGAAVSAGQLTVAGPAGSEWNIEAAIPSGAALEVTGGSVVAGGEEKPAISIRNDAPGGMGLRVQNGAAADLGGQAAGSMYGVYAAGTGAGGTPSKAGVDFAVGTADTGEVYGAYAADMAEIDLAGATANAGRTGFGAFAEMGGKIAVNGNVAGGMYGVYAEETAEITVQGDAVAEGVGIAGACAENGGVVQVLGSARGKRMGAIANGVTYDMPGQLSSDVKVSRDAVASGEAEGSTPFAAVAANDGILSVGGNALADNPLSTGARAQSGGVVTVGGIAQGVMYGAWASGDSMFRTGVSRITAGQARATAPSGRSVGACAEAYAIIRVDGAVSTGANPSGIGAEIYAYGSITIEGRLKGATYARFGSKKGGVTFRERDGVPGGGKNAGYLVYSHPKWSGFNLRTSLSQVPFVRVEGISLNAKSRLLPLGSTYRLSASFTPANATNKTVLWSSKNTSVASVAADGTVRGRKAGTTTITGKTADGGKSASCTVTVYRPLKSARMNVAAKTLAKGKSYTFRVSPTPSDATLKKVVWKSSQTSVARVNANGKVAARKNGTTIISAKITTPDGRVKTVKATLRVGGRAVTGARLSKTSATLKRGGSCTLSATVSPKNASFKGVTWRSSNTSVATVNAKGGVKALQKGTATITATTKDGNKKVSCSVRVK